VTAQKFWWEIHIPKTGMFLDLYYMIWYLYIYMYIYMYIYTWYIYILVYMIFQVSICKCSMENYGMC
jgi:hypothetical protein